MYTRYSLLDLFFGITFGDNKAYINFNTLKTNATKFQGIKNSHTAFNLLYPIFDPPGLKYFV